MAARHIRTDDSAFDVTPGETILAAALRQGVALPFSCRGGTCHTCVRRCTQGQVPERAQRGLPAPLQALSYFLPCVCEPVDDMVMTAPEPSHFTVEALLEDVAPLATGGWALRLEPLGALAWHDALTVDLSAGGHALQGQVTGLPQNDYYATVQVTQAPPADWTPGMSLSVRPSPPAAAAAPAAAGGGTRRPQPDPALWQELDDGRLVRAVLDTFYTRVFADPVLAPYFQGVTRDHVAGKQYAFLRKSMTGEPVYFGDNPRDAHHWMVIPPAVFDHRQTLMARAQRDCGLTPEQMRRWSAYEEPYRADIVKDQPLPLARFGVEQPLQGTEQAVLEVGSICDGCGAEVAAGETVQWHLRLGTLHCAACAGSGAGSSPVPAAAVMGP